MPEAPSSVRGLYPRILGDRWHDLAETVRQLHAPGGVQAVGRFRIRRGNWLARILAARARLPAQSDGVDVRLLVTSLPHHEEWVRLFGETPFGTLQWAVDDFLVERIGQCEVQFELEVIDGALHYRTRRVSLRWGSLRLPLPRWLAPCVTASETAEGAILRIHVEVTLPAIGLLIAYDGVLTSIEAKPC